MYWGMGYTPLLKSRLFASSSSPTSFQSTRPVSVVVTLAIIVTSSITKSEEVKSTFHAIRPDGQPCSRAK